MMNAAARGILPARLSTAGVVSLVDARHFLASLVMLLEVA